VTRLERLVTSPVNYWAGSALDVLVSVPAIVYGVAFAPLASTVVAVAVGTAVYSVYEYVLHRWLYHSLPSPHRRIHALHHRNPRLLIGAPIFYTQIIFGVTWLAVAALTSVAAGAVVAGVVLLLYFLQSVVHHVAHGWPGTPAALMRSPLRRRHLAHHRDGRADYGILFTFWDRALGTHRASPR
jgi:sterol desaturase/sphingolipid hydroxylase (fatty acid hydroxylase superfamily)